MENTARASAGGNRYPQWVIDMIEETEHAARTVAAHEAWQAFSNGTIQLKQHQGLLYGFWPLIDRFPHFLALNLCKCPYGRNSTLNMARAWLIKNLRIEQRHAEWYKDWAESAGVPMDTFFDGPRSAPASALTDWCWHVSKSDDLAVAMAVIHYAVEGVTGRWTRLVGDSKAYRALFPEQVRKKALRWIDVHASYSETHPWAALDMTAGLIGPSPSRATVQRITDAVQNSYELYCHSLDACFDDVGIGVAQQVFCMNGKAGDGKVCSAG